MALDWNDLRYFVAVMEHGSAARAAKALRVDQTTCSRRIQALEHALGVELFDREPGGYRPTPAALALEPRARAVAREAEALEQQAATVKRRGMGVLRVTGEDYVTNAIVAPALGRFAELYPDVQVEIDVSRELRDLVAGEADIAVRAGDPPSDPGLIRRKLTDDPWGVYATDAYIARAGRPAGIPDLANHAMVALDRAVPGIRALGLEGSVRQVVNSLGAVLAVMRTGTCLGALPGVVGDREPDLRRLFDAGATGAIWLVYPERLRNAPEVRDLARLIAEAFKPRADGTGADA